MRFSGLEIEKSRKFHEELFIREMEENQFVLSNNLFYKRFMSNFSRKSGYFCYKQFCQKTWQTFYEVARTFGFSKYIMSKKNQALYLDSFIKKSF